MPATARVTEKKQVPTVKTRGGYSAFTNSKRSDWKCSTLLRYIDVGNRLNNFSSPSPKIPGKHLRT